MLFLTRRPGQSITIQPGQGLAAGLPVGALFDNGPIVLQVNRINHDEVRLGIAAHRDLIILREELLLQPDTRLSVAIGEGPDPNPDPNSDPGPVSNHSLSPLAVVHESRGNPSSRPCSCRLLARNVTRLCRLQQWPVEQLAEASELSLTTLRAIEQGTGLITLDDLDRLAAVFGVTSSELLED